ncbi:Ras-GAP domain-containing protein [Entamoeba marina]
MSNYHDKIKPIPSLNTIRVSPIIFNDSFSDVSTPPKYSPALFSPRRSKNNSPKISCSFIPKINSPRIMTPRGTKLCQDDPIPQFYTTIKQDDCLIKTSRKSQEESLTEMFFQKDSELLNCYCESLIKNETNPSCIGTLLEFWFSRGKLVELLTNLAEKEIQTTNVHNQLFRGNTVFSKVYSKYLSKYCGGYIKETSYPFLDFIKEKYGLNGIEDALKNDNEKYTICHIFSTFLLDNVDLIPPHFKEIFQNIYSFVFQKLGEEQANKVFVTLLFLRYLLTPFITSPNLLVTIQKVLSDLLTKSTQNNDMLDDEMLKFKTNIKTLIFKIKRGPSMYTTSFKGISIAKQEKSLNQMIELIKQEMKTLSHYYNGDFTPVFCVVKGKVNYELSVSYASTQFTTWLEEKEILAKQQNEKLKSEINRISKENILLKQKIDISLQMQKMFDIY